MAPTGVPDDLLEPPRGRGRALLCVPSDDGVHHAVRAMLEAGGLVVVGEVDRGLDALAVAGDGRADVAILDLSLVGTMGLRLIALLRVVVPDITVIAISPFDTLVPAALEAGASAVVTTAELYRLPRALRELGLSR